MAGYGVYWCLVEDLYNNANELILDYEGISFDLRVSPELIKSVINDFQLFKIEGNSFFSESISRRLEKRNIKSDSAKESASAKWGKDLSKLNGMKRSERLSEARKLGTHTKEEWDEMIVFFDGHCVKCGSQENIIKDHIKPIYQGGSDGINNLQPLCRTCNSAKGPENVDYRISYCLKNACEMPANYQMMPAIKESKEKDIKENKEKKELIPQRTKPPAEAVGSPPLISINKPVKKINLIQSVINAFVEEHGSYEILSPGKERKMAEKIISEYRIKHPDQKFDEIITGLRAYFKKCLAIDQPWLRTNMSLGVIVSQYNTINKILSEKENKPRERLIMP
jgi:5-methylcytosine-specific restriction endonuclease McrA